LISRDRTIDAVASGENTHVLLEQELRLPQLFEEREDFLKNTI